MPSPLPGMDPYIEQPIVWSDFHSALAGAIRAALNAQIRPRYVARLTPYVTYDHIEILSPVNKRRGHDAFHDYLRKRRDLLRSAAHLIEIDLLRAGERPPLEAPVPAAPYYVTLARANRRPGVQVWPIQLWDKLPVVPVPLREPDPDAAINLPAVLAEVYEDGGYELLIDYRQPPPPPELSPVEAEWLDRYLASRGQIR